jgi:hypothetical protein
MGRLDPALPGDILDRVLGTRDAIVTLLSPEDSAVRVFRARTHDDECVIRMLDAGVVRDRRTQEITSARLAGERGVGLRVRTVDPDARWFALEFVDGGSVTAGPHLLEPLAVLLRRLHQTPRDGIPPVPSLSDRLGRRLSEINVPQPLRDALQSLLDIRPAPPSALCHMRLRLDNILASPRGLLLVDFAWAGLGDPYTDVAFLTNELALADADALLRLWLGRSPAHDESRHLRAMRALALGLESALACPRAALADAPGWGLEELQDGDESPSVGAIARLDAMMRRLHGVEGPPFRLDSPGAYRVYAAVCLRAALALVEKYTSA